MESHMSLIKDKLFSTEAFAHTFMYRYPALIRRISRQAMNIINLKLHSFYLLKLYVLYAVLRDINSMKEGPTNDRLTLGSRLSAASGAAV